MRKTHLLLLTSLYCQLHSLEPEKEMHDALLQGQIAQAEAGGMAKFFGQEIVVSEDEIAQGPHLLAASAVNQRILVRNVKGLLLAGSPEAAAQANVKDVQGVEAVDLEVPGGIANLKRRLEPLFLDKSLTEPEIINLKRAIILYYRDYKRPVVTVQIPEQDVTDGTLTFIVTESKVGRVVAKGNRWTSSKRLENAVELKPGDNIDENILFADLDYLNRNPFRHVDILYTPGEQPGTTDIELLTKDRFPLRPYIGADNTGVKPLSRDRYFAGFNWGNAFGLDHILSYQYTASFSSMRFQAHTAQYTAPLPWHHIVTAWGGYSHVKARIFTQGMRTQGNSYQASLRYTVPLKPYTHYLHEVNAGFDFKRTNNTLEFVEVLPVFGKNVNLTQVALGYNSGYERSTYKFGFDFQLFFSPASMFSDQSNADFQSLRPHAKSHYVYGLATFSYLQQLPKSFYLSLMLNGQWADANLLPSEQFGIGGYDTVRGYEERAYNADNAVLVNLELRSPPLGIVKYWTKLKDNLQFLVFADYGYGREHQGSPGIPKHQYLAGVGPGIRYTLDPYITARFDWGIKLHHNPQFAGGNTMIHFSVILSY